MKFLNKQEQVIDLKLTQYGKSLLSTGKLRPVYYAFFDDGILYDGSRAGLTEAQNSIQYRIKNETLYMKDTKDYLSPDEKDGSLSAVPGEGSVIDQLLFDFNSTFENQLGASSNNKPGPPAWQVSLLQSTLTSSAIVLTSSANSRNLPIPQLNIDSDSISYRVSVVEDDNSALLDGTQCEIDDIINQDLALFPDGTRLKAEEGSILIEVEEANSLSLMKNFDFELFEVISVTGSIRSVTDKQILRPLKFFKFDSQVQDGILLDNDAAFKNFDNLDKVDDSFASYYLDILVDSEVDKSLICSPGKKVRKANTLFIKDPIHCDDTEMSSRTTVYDPLDDDDMQAFKDSLGEDCD